MEGFVSLKHLSNELGIDRSHLRRYVRKLGIKAHKRRTVDSRNQLTLAVNCDEAEFIREKRTNEGFIGEGAALCRDVGVFYVIRLIPELDSRRIKMGFTDDLIARLSQHRTAAPTAEAVAAFPCKRGWEATVMDCLSSCKCRLILNEVFECDDVSGLVEYAKKIFELFPSPDFRVALSMNQG